MISGLDRIVGLHAAKGGAVSLERFQEQINVIFHDYEATVYDDIHTQGWVDLPRELDRLLRESGLKADAKGRRLLDVGCGTGRGTDMLLKSAVGPSIGGAVLLDTSPGMIEKSRRRAAGWPIETEFFTGLLEDLKTDGGFDLIITSSVLHHIPDMTGMLSRIASLLAVGGHYIEMVEPHSTAMSGSVLPGRLAELSSYEEAARRSWKSRLAGRASRYRDGVVRRARRLLGAPEQRYYLEKVNDELLAKGIIRAPLTGAEIASVTDIHDWEEGGVGIPGLAEGLKGCTLVAWCSFAFFGILRSGLPAPFQAREDELASAKDRDGARISSMWRREG